MQDAKANSHYAEAKFFHNYPPAHAVVSRIKGLHKALHTTELLTPVIQGLQADLAPENDLNSVKSEKS